jgi:hypothetical protein
MICVFWLPFDIGLFGHCENECNLIALWKWFIWPLWEIMYLVCPMTVVYSVTVIIGVFLLPFDSGLLGHCDDLCILLLNDSSLFGQCDDLCILIHIWQWFIWRLSINIFRLPYDSGLFGHCENWCILIAIDSGLLGHCDDLCILLLNDSSLFGHCDDFCILIHLWQWFIWPL